VSNRPEFSLTQLLYFVTIAETENISEAATQLHASQSAVSSAMQRLERQLGVQLLLRQRTKGVVLTPSGRLLLDDARKILRQARELKDYSSRLQGTTAGHLDVGSCWTITPFLIPRTLAALALSRPGLKVSVHDTHTPNDLLRDGVCELVVTYGFAATEETRFTEVVTPPLYAVVGERHPLATATYATLDEFADQPLLMFNLSGTNVHYSYVQAVFRKSKAPMPPVIQVTGLESMRSLVSAGVGFMLTHHPHPTETLGGGRVALVEIVGDRPHLAIGVKTLAETRLSRRAHAFVESLRTVAEQVYEPIPASPVR
jgi:DNA-binding transcriptional LysR family regulator